MPPRKPIYLAGPTAVGKSAIALTLAERTDGEIVSADSMQVYRGLDIGSAKPTPAEQARVRHHLIDICDLNETFDAAQFTVRAKAAIDDIQSRDRTPIICGGTGLYFQALLAGLGDAPTSNPELRAKLEATPLEELRAELERADPVCFGRIDLQNPRRVIRAIEVIRLTGRPFSDQRADWSSAAA
ncbi:MAG: tRNA dimethylallyltransferase, partial [Candidatus Binatia bacterium]